MSFKFAGVIPPSKSLFNRWLIVKSFASNKFSISNTCESEDVKLLKDCLETLNLGGKEFYVGKGGTTFRFLALRLSREKGSFYIQMDAQLRARPNADLIAALQAFGVRCEWTRQGLLLECSGWSASRIRVGTEITTQVLSGILLNAWHLPFSLEIEFLPPVVSKGYFELTLAVLRQAGMQIDIGSADGFARALVASKQTVRLSQVEVESDMSSAFSIAALAAVGGSACLERFPFQSLQPDIGFGGVLRSMGVDIEERVEDRVLVIRKPESLRPIKISIEHFPDLFPVLAVLCALADGESVLDGAPQLRFKESDRIAGVAAILQAMNVRYEVLPGGLRIYGRRQRDEVRRHVASHDDHRLIMATAVANLAGYHLEIDRPSEVKKSFPEFWDIYARGLQ